MTTTAFDDQFTDAPELVRQPYDTASILRRNVADLEIALKQQTERAEAAEAELASLRWQEPVATLLLSYDGADFEMYYDNNKLRFEGMSMKLYAAAGAAPAVPEEWREVMKELADDLAIEIDQDYPPERRAYPSEQRKYEGEMVIVNRARALLQSAEGGK